MGNIIRPGNFIYHGCRFLSNYDGDTIDFSIHADGYDFGFGFIVNAPADLVRIRVRLWGMDTYELRGGDEETKAKAQQARDYVYDMLIAARSITIVTFKDKGDSFGRYLAKVYYHTAPNAQDIAQMTCLNRELIDLKLTTGRYEDLWEEEAGV